VESDDNAVEDTSLLKMDAHIIPLEKLVERFNSNLTEGLSNDTVTQHRATFGQNKLTPSRPPSLLWMFIKQLLIGFNGILWLATLFAFLSYVSSLLFFIQKINRWYTELQIICLCRNRSVSPILI
jgi:magnesium-transporting ATPase (P-type)